MCITETITPADDAQCAEGRGSADTSSRTSSRAAAAPTRRCTSSRRATRSKVPDSEIQRISCAPTVTAPNLICVVSLYMSCPSQKDSPTEDAIELPSPSKTGTTQIAVRIRGARAPGRLRHMGAWLEARIRTKGKPGAPLREAVALLGTGQYVGAHDEDYVSEKEALLDHKSGLSEGSLTN